MQIAKSRVLYQLAGQRCFSAMVAEKIPSACPFSELFSADMSSSTSRTEPSTISFNAPAPAFQPAVSSVKRFQEIPGPKGLPVIGTLLDYVKPNGLRFDKLFEVYRQRSEEFGGIYKEQIGHIRTVVVSDPAEYKKLIRAEAHWPYPERFALAPLVHYKQKKGMPLGVVHAQGKEWHTDRMVLAQKTLIPRRIGTHVPSLMTVADDFVSNLKNEVQDNGGEIDQLNNKVFKWALESLGEVLFGERIGVFDQTAEGDAKTAHVFLTHLLGVFKYMQKLLYSAPTYKYVPTADWKAFEYHADETLKMAEYFVSKRVTSTTDSGKSNAILHSLLQEDNLSVEKAVQLTMDLLIGGIETTSNTILWMMMELAKNPETQAKARAEVRQMLAKKAPGSRVTADDIARLPYCKAVMKETFRMYPVTFATTRIIPEAIEIGGYEIPAKTHVQANLYTMNRNPKYFEEPENFKPERWLKENSAEMEHRFLHSLVWGHGPRMCIGRRIAETEMTVLMVKLLDTFSFETTGEAKDAVQPVLYTIMNLDRDLRLKYNVLQPATNN